MTQPGEAVSVGSPIPISAIVLTFNEERNLSECLASIRPYVSQIFVVDSYSTDRTVAIATGFGALVTQRRFITHSEQLRWALQHVGVATEWVIRVDADERWTADGFAELQRLIADRELAGVYVRMKIFFMHRWIRHGDMYPNYFLRAFRHSMAAIEARGMDEHVSVSGRTYLSRIDVIESNFDRQENVSLWTLKHDRYSTREAIDYICMKYDTGDLKSIGSLSGNRTERKRWAKERVYYRLPLFLRAIGYFLYRWLVKRGCLDGIEGLIFHVLQGFWYRFLVDAKIFQIERRIVRFGETAAVAIRELYDVDIEGGKHSELETRVK